MLRSSHFSKTIQWANNTTVELWLLGFFGVWVAFNIDSIALRHLLFLRSVLRIIMGGIPLRRKYILGSSEIWHRSVLMLAFNC